IGLGWLSLALGIAEVAAAGSLAKALGMDGKDWLIRAYGVREIASGVASLSTERPTGLWARVGGDMLDVATLIPALSVRNPKRHNVALALGVVLGITLLDLAAAQATSTSRRRHRGELRDYSDRTGWPKGIDKSKGAGRTS
ncbi:hypothetical protein AB4144_38210, partial [Rhizobiaceae sp. 2RAB30]